MKLHPDKACPDCGKPMLFSLNLESGKTGPLETRSTIYVVRGDLDPSGAKANTAKNFLEMVDVVVLKDGTRISGEMLAFCVSHFNTCSNPAKFSRR